MPVAQYPLGIIALLDLRLCCIHSEQHLAALVAPHGRCAKEVALCRGALRHDVFRLSAGNLRHREYFARFLGLILQVLQRHGISKGVVVRHQRRQVLELREALADSVSHAAWRDFVQAFHVAVHARP